MQRFSLASLGPDDRHARQGHGPTTPGSTDYTKISPLDLEKQTPKGKLSNPYKDTQADIVAQGESLFRSYSCSGCHGGTGGGGMCPPLTNDTWVYGGDDDTLFRLVTLGSDELQKEGYTRIGHENVVGPMPPFGSIIKNADDLWKIIRLHSLALRRRSRLQVRNARIGTMSEASAARRSGRRSSVGRGARSCCSAYCHFE